MEWRMEKINDWFDVSTGGTPSRAKDIYWGGDIKWMASGDINKIRIDDVEGRITELGLKNSNTKLLPPKTVMVALNGQGKTRGMVAITETTLTCNQSLASIVPREKNTIDSEYIFWNLYSRYKEIRNIRGGEFRSGLNLSHIREIQFPVPFLNGVPDLNEQKRQAEKLSKIFSENKEAHKVLDEQVLLVSDLKQSLLDKIFSQPDLKKVKLSEIADVNPQKVFGNLHSNDDVSFVPMNSVDEVSGSITKELNRKLGTVSKNYTFFQNSDVIFAKITPCMENGKCAVARNLTNGIAFGSTEFYVIRARENISPEYIWHFLRQQRVRKEASYQFTGAAGHKRVPKHFIENLELPLPFKKGVVDLDGQRKIVDGLNRHLAMAENLSGFITNQKESFDTLLSAILNESFKSKEVLAKNSVLSPLQNITISPIQEASALVLRRFQRGEMVLAKLLYIAQSVYKIPLGISFTQQTFGPYSSQISQSVKDGLSPKKQFFSRKGIQGKEVLTLGASGAYILNRVSDSIRKQMNSYLDQMMPHYFSSDSQSIELLATVCKIIEDEKTSDDVVIRQKLQKWKPGRFQDSETFRTLSFVKKNKWDQKILQ